MACLARALLLSLILAVFLLSPVQHFMAGVKSHPASAYGGPNRSLRVAEASDCRLISLIGGDRMPMRRLMEAHQ